MIVADGVTEEMRLATEAKFKAWDDVAASNVLETGTEAEQCAVYRMLQDPTVYAYAFFRDPKHPMKPFRMYAYQDAVINDPHPRVYFNAANQIGKSLALCVKAAHYAILNPGRTVLMTSKTLPQSKDLLRQIKALLQSSSLEYRYDIGDSETKTEIYFRHYEEVVVHDKELDKDFVELRELPQSRIVCVPATEAALGYAVDLALVDELHFYENGEYFYKQILQPRTYTTKGQIMVFTNPNGQQGIGWELWNSPEFHCYRFNYLDCPTNTQAEFDALSAGLTREEIDSTLLAVFTSPEGGFFSLQERKDMQEERSSVIPVALTSPIFIFFDWAKTMDRTVRATGVAVRRNDKDWADEVYVHEMLEYPSGTPYSDIIDVDLKNLVERVGLKMVAMVGWDNTGVGKGLEDFVGRVEQLGIPAQPVEFSGENKSRIYTLFKLLAEQRRIKIPYNKECDKQLSMLRFRKSARGYLMVHHESEKERDDFPDALAGLSSLIVQPDNVPVTCVIV